MDEGNFQNESITAFISYSREDPEQTRWVRNLAARLRLDGIETTLDQWHAVPGDQLPLFMERAVAENDYVLIVCTPVYKVRSDARRGGVGYEGDVITGAVLQGHATRKFIPLLRRGVWEDASPTWMTGKLFIDFSDAAESEAAYKELLMTLRSERDPAPPVRTRTSKAHAELEKSSDVDHQVSNGAGLGTLVSTDTGSARIELTLDRDFDAFGPEAQSAVLESIRHLLHVSESEIRIVKKSRGSVKLVLELPYERLHELKTLVDTGALDHLGLLDAHEFPEAHAGPALSAEGPRKLVPGIVVETRGEEVFVELGPRMQGVLPAAEFDEPPTVGETMNFFLRGREEDNLWRLSLRGAKELAAWNELQPGSLVKARVTGQNTGGLELSIGPGKAFMPASQVALHRIEDLSSLLGESFVTKVIEVDSSRKRVVLSRRAVLEAELHEARAQASEHLQVGQTIRGKVTRLESFGAFIDLGGGLEGLAHVSNLSRQRVEKAEDVVSMGQDVEAMILDIKEGGRRIGLGLKQLEPDPWDHLPPGVSEESVLQGRVTRLTEFGAFVEIAPGIEGLCHVSQLGLGGGRRRPEEAVSVGQEVTVRIVSIELDRQRISLSMLDRRGAIIGSEDAVDEEVLRKSMSQSQESPQVNFGDFFRRTQL